MRTEELQELIHQHGETARSYACEAVKIGEAYIIQNFGFNRTAQTALEQLLKLRKSQEYDLYNLQYYNPSDYGLVDIRIFAIPENFTLFGDESFIEKVEDESSPIEDLVVFCQEIYPKDYPYSSLPEWWTEKMVQKTSQTMDVIDFAEWMQTMLCPEEEEEEALNRWLQAIHPWLGDEVTLYKLEDDNNSNCAFCPFIFVGDRCLILAAYRWAL